MRIYLFGYASDDFVGRVVVTPDERTVAYLAQQLVAWGLSPETGARLTVRNEAGDDLDPASTVATAGLSNGDIFTGAHTWRTRYRDGGTRGALRLRPILRVT